MLNKKSKKKKKTAKNHKNPALFLVILFKLFWVLNIWPLYFAKKMKNVCIVYMPFVTRKVFRYLPVECFFFWWNRLVIYFYSKMLYVFYFNLFKCVVPSYYTYCKLRVDLRNISHVMRWLLHFAVFSKKKLSSIDVIYFLLNFLITKLVIF